MRAAVPRMARVGREALLGPRGDRPGTPWPRRGAQWRTVRVRRRDVDGAVRARARGSGILAARPEVARGWSALERGEGDGQVDGAPDGRAPRWRGRPEVRSGGEHVFAKVWAAPDGSGGVQAILQRPRRGRPEAAAWRAGAAAWRAGAAAWRAVAAAWRAGAAAWRAGAAAWRAGAAAWRAGTASPARTWPHAGRSAGPTRPLARPRPSSPARTRRRPSCAPD
jgi:hypothetical protein